MIALIFNDIKRVKINFVLKVILQLDVLKSLPNSSTSKNKTTNGIWPGQPSPHPVATNIDHTVHCLYVPRPIYIAYQNPRGWSWYLEWKKTNSTISFSFTMVLWRKLSPPHPPKQQRQILLHLGLRYFSLKSCLEAVIL